MRTIYCGLPRFNSMHRRSAFSLTELLIVMAIVSGLLALLLPAIQQARGSARRATCLSNLKELGLGFQLYHSARGRFPRYRLCPAPWQGGQDMLCTQVPSAVFHTGPNEAWWAPYDSRVAPTDPPLADFDPSRAFLYPYLEGNLATFLCPEGVDLNPASDTYGRQYQISFAMNRVVAGPAGRRLVEIVNGNGSSKVLLGWDHDNTPGCADDEGLPWRPYDDRAALPHYPVWRHAGVFNALSCDGHVDSLLAETLHDDQFNVH